MEPSEQFAEMMERHKCLIRRLCVRYSEGDEQLCRDLMQEVAVGMWLRYSEREWKVWSGAQRAWVYWQTRHFASHAVLNVTDKSTLHVKRGATLRVCGAGHVEIGDRAYICIDDGANIHLLDTLSAVNLMPTTTCGVYAGGSAPAGNCTNTDLTQFPLQVGSKGAIHRHNNNAVYIQRKTYTGKAYIYGSQIYAGNNVMPLNKPGDVVVKNGSHVIWDAMNGVHLEPGVRVEAGGALEVR